MNPLYAHLKYPERAEVLGEEEYRFYRVSLAHWRPLVMPFRTAFQAVYTRGMAKVLLLHGLQGAGKTLYCSKLQQDFEQTQKDSSHLDTDNNLWHQLAAGLNPSREELKEVTSLTRIRKPIATEGWLDELRKQVKSDAHLQCTVVILDDAHSEEFLCEWAKLEYKGRTEDEIIGLIHAAGTHLVAECRSDFRRCLFLFLSNRKDELNRLHNVIEKNHQRLSVSLDLPIPTAEDKESIVRKNTNALNQVSYWACLDRSGPVEKSKVFNELKQPSGFTRAFEALNDAYVYSSSASSRSGRPSHKNLISLVLLGSGPNQTKSDVEHFGLKIPNDSMLGTKNTEHVATWWFPETWASLLCSNPNTEEFRQAKMLESEFSLRIVAFDFSATFGLCYPEITEELSNTLVQLLKTSPHTFSQQGKI
jgi:adenylate kinase family enzyme